MTHLGLRLQTHTLQRRLVGLGDATTVLIEVAGERLHQQVGFGAVLEDAAGARVLALRI